MVGERQGAIEGYGIDILARNFMRHVFFPAYPCSIIRLSKEPDGVIRAMSVQPITLNVPYLNMQYVLPLHESPRTTQDLLDQQPHPYLPEALATDFEIALRAQALKPDLYHSMLGEFLFQSSRYTSQELDRMQAGLPRMARRSMPGSNYIEVPYDYKQMIISNLEQIRRQRMFTRMFGP